jgi:hypothetical protein
LKHGQIDFRTFQSLETSDDSKSANNAQDANINDKSSPDKSHTDESPLPTQTSSSQSDSKPLDKMPSASKRASYTVQELLKKRTDPLAQIRPNNLKIVEGITQLRSSMQLTRQSTMDNHGSSLSLHSSITLEKPALHNRSANPYVRIDQSRVDANNKYLRDVTSILNKVTPQTYSKLLQKLEELELTNDQRLEGLIRIIFSKAVDEPSFCFLYAKLCKQFERKQVTVPNEDGQLIVHYFRQILLTRCQKEFENDYRQEIDYEKRLADVKEITDEKVQKEEAEKLEEDLGKAKRKKLGNIL